MTTVEELLVQVELAIEEYCFDQGIDPSEGDAMAADMAEAIAWDVDTDTALEFFRRYLGWVPQGFAQARGVEHTDWLE